MTKKLGLTIEKLLKKHKVATALDLTCCTSSQVFLAIKLWDRILVPPF